MNEPYDYDEFFVIYAVREPRWPARKCMLMYQGLAKNNIACNDHGAGEIYFSAGATDFKAILVENLPGAGSAAATATPTAAPPAPPTTTTTEAAPAPAPTPADGATSAPAPAPSSEGQVGASAPATSGGGGGGGMCALTTARDDRSPVTALAALALLAGALLRARVRARR